MLPNSNNQLSTAKLKCAQLQIPGERTCFNNETLSSSTSNNISTTSGQTKPSMIETTTNKIALSIFDQKDFFDENIDKLKNYRQLMDSHQIKIKSFSTSDIESQMHHECITNEAIVSPLSWNSKKYLSDCDLADYYKFNANEKECIKDYITYSCSTLAICGDTIHSSQLPSPQAQSYRQLNSIIFSDLDLAKSLNKKVINICIKQRLMEFTKVINQSTLSQMELDNIAKISSDIIMKPLKMNYDFQPQEYSTGEIFINVVNYEQNEVKFTKQDKEKFVLNWLQTVEPAAVLESN